MKRSLLTILPLVAFLMLPLLAVGQEAQIPAIVQIGSIEHDGSWQTGTVFGFDIPTGGIPQVGDVLQKVEVTSLWAKPDFSDEVTLYALRAFTVDQFGISKLGQSGAVFYGGYGAGYTHLLNQMGADDEYLTWRLELGFKFPWIGRVWEAYAGCDFMMPEVIAYEPERYYPHINISMQLPQLL